MRSQLENGCDETIAMGRSMTSGRGALLLLARAMMVLIGGLLLFNEQG